MVFHQTTSDEVTTTYVQESSPIVETCNSDSLRVDKSLKNSSTLQERIHSLPLETLRTYAFSVAQRASFLEQQLSILESERRLNDAKSSRRNQQTLLSTSARDQQLRKSVEDLQFQLSAQLSIRRDHEETIAKMREICKTAKVTIENGRLQREDLQSELENKSRELEELRNELFDALILNEHLNEKCETYNLEIDRERARQHELEKCITLGQEVRALNFVSNLFSDICQRIDSQTSKDNDCSLKETTNSKNNPSLNAVSQMAAKVSSLMTQMIPNLPKPSIELKNVSTLSAITDLKFDTIKADEARSELTLSTACSNLDSELFDLCPNANDRKISNYGNDSQFNKLENSPSAASVASIIVPLSHQEIQKVDIVKLLKKEEQTSRERGGKRKSGCGGNRRRRSEGVKNLQSLKKRVGRPPPRLTVGD